MKQKPFLTRRKFLQGTAILLGGVGLVVVKEIITSKANQLANFNQYVPIERTLKSSTPIPPTGTPTPTTTRTATATPTQTRTATRTGTATPTATSTGVSQTSVPPALAGKVVHIRNAGATNWSGTGYFYDSNAVNQTAVDGMALGGLSALTGKSTWPAIWAALFGQVHPGGYSAGQKIAIKVSFNNSARNGNTCSVHSNMIDALPQPVLALIKGMAEAGVRSQDIIIYDATRTSPGNTPGRIIPDYFRNPILAAYPDVTFVGSSTCSGVLAPGFGKDASLTVKLNTSNGTLTRQLADVLFDASYLINMPIPKIHSGPTNIPMSLGLKNHLGSLNYVLGSGIDSLHEYIEMAPQGVYYSSTYSPLVDIYANPNIRSKTILTVGDGLYGADNVTGTARLKWNIYNDALNSLFFAADPVAVDCVMADFLRKEGLLTVNAAYDYLFCAETAGLGICEGTRASPGNPNPLTQPYTKITYIYQSQ